MFQRRPQSTPTQKWRSCRRGHTHTAKARARGRRCAFFPLFPPATGLVHRASCHYTARGWSIIPPTCTFRPDNSRTTWPPPSSCGTSPYRSATSTRTAPPSGRCGRCGRRLGALLFRRVRRVQKLRSHVSRRIHRQPHRRASLRDGGCDRRTLRVERHSGRLIRSHGHGRVRGPTRGRPNRR